MSAAVKPIAGDALAPAAPAGAHKAAVIPHPSAPALAAAADRAAAATVFVDRGRQRARRELAAKIAAPLLGVLAFLGIWALVASLGSIPGPVKTWEAAMQVFSDPFYQN